MASNEIEANMAGEEDKTCENEEPTEQSSEILVEPKDQVYEKIKSKIEILDMIFHPTETNLISLGLINGKLRM